MFPESKHLCLSGLEQQDSHTQNLAIRMCNHLPTTMCVNCHFDIKYVGHLFIRYPFSTQARNMGVHKDFTSVTKPKKSRISCPKPSSRTFG